MNTTIRSFAVAFAVLAGSASAAPTTWNFSGNDGTGQYSRIFTATDGISTTAARAFSTSNGSGSGLFNNAKITIFGGGLGIRSSGENGSAPNHAVDNSGYDELFVFDFGTDVDFLSFKLGYISNDSDVDVHVGGSGALNFNNLCYAGCVSTLASLGFTKVHFENVPVNSATADTSSSTGRYLVFGAESPVQDGHKDKYDYFKLKQITAEEVVPIREVPEPAAVLLVGLGLLGMGFSRRFVRA